MSMQSEQINDVMTALAKAQGQMEPAIKDSSNPHFKSKYADLASVWEACREALSKNGLAVTQTMDFVGEKQVLITTLGHSSGQWIKSIIALPIQKPGPHELGSCLSYCRRYALAAMVGVYQDDDDANAAQKPYTKPKPQFEQPKVEMNGQLLPEIPKPRTTISDAEWASLDDLVQKVNNVEFVNKLSDFVEAQTIWDIKPKDYDRIVKRLEQELQGKSA